MLRFFRDAFRIVTRGTVECDHAWKEDGFRRHCPRCGTHQMRMENRYPEVGQPKYEWV